MAQIKASTGAAPAPEVRPKDHRRQFTAEYEQKLVLLYQSVE